MGRIMRLPVFKAQGENPTASDFSLLQTKWKSILDPVVILPQNDGVILTGIVLINGQTIVPHKLGRVPLGWRLTDINGAATVYRSQPFNSATLVLTSSAKVTVNLEIF
jgi:hypothetical protein